MVFHKGSTPTVILNVLLIFGEQYLKPQGQSFLSEYAAHCQASETHCHMAEVYYNIGRAFHLLGITSIAHQYYTRANELYRQTYSSSMSATTFNQVISLLNVNNTQSAYALLSRDLRLQHHTSRHLHCLPRVSEGNIQYFGPYGCLRWSNKTSSRTC